MSNEPLVDMTCKYLQSHTITPLLSLRNRCAWAHPPAVRGVAGYVTDLPMDVAAKVREITIKRL